MEKIQKWEKRKSFFEITNCNNGLSSSFLWYSSAKSPPLQMIHKILSLGLKENVSEEEIHYLIPGVIIE